MVNTGVKKSAKVLVGLTGRVSSAVAAFLLKKQGYSVMGVVIETNNSSDFKSSEFAPHCHIQDLDQIKRFCQSIKIPVHVVDGRSQFDDVVVDKLLGRKISGLENNSCFDCTRFKFEALMSKMLELEADFIATGHYAKIQKNSSSGELSIHSSSDNSCDQSHLLAGLGNDLLNHLILPLGEIGKIEVDKICEKFNLPILQPNNEFNFCFNCPESYAFKSKKMIPESLMKFGEAVNIDTDSNYGKHEGFYKYKATQTALKFDHYTTPTNAIKYEVVGFNHENNSLLIGEKEHLTFKGILISEVTLDRSFNKTKPMVCYIKSKSFLNYIKCIATFKNNSNMLLEFEEDVYPLIYGDKIVLYDSAIKNSRVLGSGIVSSRGELTLVDRASEFRVRDESDDLEPVYLKF